MASPDPKSTELTRRLTLALNGKRGVARRHHPGQPFPIRRIDAGPIFLPTGRICATDAYEGDDTPPLNRIVPPGEYAVEIVVAQRPQNLRFGNERAAFLLVKFAPGDPAAWTPLTAVAPADPNFLDEEPHAFVQEGATAIFSPEAGAVHFAHLKQQFDEQLKLLRKQAQRFGSNDWLNYRPGQDRPNLILVEGGFGDGTCYCYAGLSPAGRMTHLVIDFDVADPAEA